jgi:hypothetical protein
MVVRSSRLGMPASAEDAPGATRRLREVEALHGPVDLGSLTRSAIEAAENGSHPQRRVVVVGDFPSHSIEDAALSSLSSVASTLSEKSIRPVISFWNLGVNSDQLANVSVQSVEVDSPAVVARRIATYSAILQNSSDVPMRDLRVVWTIAGTELSPTLVSISPRSSYTCRITHRIDEVGVHPVTVAIEHADALMEDNRRSMAVDVIREIDVLLVNGQPGSAPLEGETDYLAVALSPYAFGGDDQPDAVRTTVIQAGQIEQQLTERQPDVVVMANVDALSQQARRDVSQFVLQGGSLVVFDGQQLDPDAYNEPWACDQGSWQLPSKLGSIIELSADGLSEANEGDISANRSPNVGSRNPLYSAWDVLGPADQQSFADVEIHRYRQLSIHDPEPETAASSEPPLTVADTKPSEPALVLWSMSNGDPLAISARRGLGRVIQFAIPCDTQWSTLPLRLVYLPMMQQLVLELAGSRRNTTLAVGEGFSVAVSELSAILPEGAKIDESQPPTFRLQPPVGEEIVMEASNEAPSQLTVIRTETPGSYRLRKTTSLLDAPAVITSTLRIAEVPSIESQLRDADPARLAAAAKLVEASVFSDVGELQSDDRTRRFGREIWRWLLLALLVVLLGELWLQQQSVKSVRRRAP